MIIRETGHNCASGAATGDMNANDMRSTGVTLRNLEFSNFDQTESLSGSICLLSPPTCVDHDQCSVVALIHMMTSLIDPAHAQHCTVLLSV